MAGDRDWSTEPGREEHGITFGAPPGGPGPEPPPPTFTSGPAPFVSGAAVNRIRSHPEGTTIFLLGLASVLLCPLIGPLAWSMGNKAMGEVRYSGYRFRNAGLIRAGRLLGAFATCLIVVYVLLVLAVFSARSDQALPATGRVAAVSATGSTS